MNNTLYNLAGGLLAWNGHTVKDFPKLRVFSLHGKPADIYYQAMDLERGAYHFYTEVLARHPEKGFAHSIDLLARAEEGHARLIYDWYKKACPQAPPFAELYNSLPGNVLEGGKGIEEMKKLLDRPGEDPCLDIIEMAIDIEFTAYDLYRAMADFFSETELQQCFLSIAQAEKEHMRIAAEALTSCQYA